MSPSQEPVRDPYGPNPLQVRPVDMEIRDGELHISVRREFDEGARNASWADTVIDACPGPYRQVVIDLHHRPMISSTFFAGSLQLREHYGKSGRVVVRLVNVSDRIRRTLEMMGLHSVFEFARPPADG